MFPLQIKNIFSKIRSSIVRKIHSAPGSSTLYRLERRALVRLRGAGAAAGGGEVSAFLQGLLTNDMRHFEEGATSIYAMFLNAKGRVLYDTIVHATGERDAFLLECDIEVLSALQKHIKIYRLKKKIDIDDISKDFNLFALIGDHDKPGTYLKDIKMHKDPRMQSLGSRIIAPSNVEVLDLCRSLGRNVSVAESDDYRYLRYRLGVGEGADDLPPGTCMPLEANCDYLHGVSFHKGCYIGQELTARSHHTLVVRRRFMPLKFEKAPTEPIPHDALIADGANPNSKTGKLKGVLSDYGLALVRISEALQAGSLVVAGHKAAVEKPSWWPIEAPKEKVSAAKADA